MEQTERENKKCYFMVIGATIGVELSKQKVKHLQPGLKQIAVNRQAAHLGHVTSPRGKFYLQLRSRTRRLEAWVGSERFSFINGPLIRSYYHV